MNWLEWTNVAAATAISTAVNGIWLGMLLSVLASAAIRLLPRPNATTRYAIWLIALLLVIAAPFLLLIPRPPAAIATTPTSTPWTVPITAQWPVYAALVWLAITLVLMARVCWSFAHIHGLKRRAALLGQRGHIKVLASIEVPVPMAAGFVRRAIVFPQSVLEQLTPQEFEQVLCHEMAHLRRWDDWTQLLHAVAQAVLFFNPAIYWIGRRLKIEREMACDDWVVTATGQPRPYAACLTHLHEVTRRVPVPQLAPGATSGKRWHISARVEALLQPDRNTTPRFARSGWMAACGLVGACLMVAARTTPPVGVQEIPLATMALAHPGAPSAPAISLAAVPPRELPARPRLAANRVPKGELPLQLALRDGPVLVRAWHIEMYPTYLAVTVVLYEPPPHTPTKGT